jgi:tetratricopeptide (TPR) repeat protein
MMNRNKMVASFALALAAAACGGQTSSGPQPSVAESRQETRGTAEKVEHTGECAAMRAKDPAMAEAGDLLHAEKYSDAAEKYGAIAAANPENAKAALMHGYALHAAGRLDEALVAHERAAQFADVKATALYNAACVLALQGQTDKAFAKLDESIKAGFWMADHMQKDDDLKSLRTDARFDGAMKAAAANPQKEHEKKAKSGKNGEMCQHPSHQKHAKK